jgi:DNA-binding winged helix-turn-helix (wHTH) protein
MTLCRKVAVLAGASLRASLVEQLQRHRELAALELDADDLAPERLARLAPDIAILDSDALPLDATARIRSAGFAGPLLLIGGGGGAPADGRAERLARPFRFATLLARLRAHLGPAAAPRETVTLGDYHFTPGAAELAHRAGGTLRLTGTEAAILGRLARDAGETVAKDMLLREIWGYHPGVTSRTLETHVYRLRRKLEPDLSSPRLLRTEKSGYRLICSVDSSPRAGPAP